MELKVLWHEGLFMQAHHLQQQERYLEGYSWALTREVAPLCYGFRALDIDETQLAVGVFSLKRAIGFMQDGTNFSLAAEHGQLVNLRLSGQSIKQIIYLCLTSTSSVSNEVHFENLGNTNHNKRFLAVDAQIADVVTKDAEKIVAQLALPNLTLKLEKDLSGQEVYLPVARVHNVHTDGKVVLDASYIPPITRCNVSMVLQSHLLSSLQLIESRANSLAARLSQPAQRGAGEVVDFLSLQCLNRYRTILKHIERDLSPHPLYFYQLLIQLLGELSTYLSEKRMPDELSSYRHESLDLTFAPLMQVLRSYLVDILDQTVLEIPIEDRGNGYKLVRNLDSNILKTAQFVLAISADVPAATLTTGLLQSTKIGPVEQIANMVKFALPGVGMRHLNVAPRQLPFLAGFSYFELDLKPEHRTQMEEKNAMAIYMAHAQAWPGLKLMLWAIKK